MHLPATTRIGVAAFLLCAVVGGLDAQSARFELLRRDGNDIPALGAQITRGFAGETASAAFQAIANEARLNLTFDPRLDGLETKLAIPPHVRTAAVALLEVAEASRLVVRVSSIGQLIVGAAPNAPPTAARTSPRSPAARDGVTLPTVESRASRVERDAFEHRSDVGTVAITPRELAAAPRFFAEADVLRAAQTMPGVQARNDYASGMNVQGGEADQNLILLDGYPIYNPFHLGGVFGTFIEPAVGRVDLATAGFASRYGGRLSGVLDVRSADEMRSGIHGTANVSLLATTVSLGSAMDDGKGSWNVAARRTYADVLIGLFDRGALPYHFQDGQAHVTRVLPGDVRLSATVYGGVDAANIVPSNGEPHDISWGNRVIGATVAKTWHDEPRLGGLRLGDSVSLEQRISDSRFLTDVSIAGGALRIAGRVQDARIAGSLTAFAGRHRPSIGYDVSSQRLTYTANNPAPFVPLDSSGQRLLATSLYANDQWRPTPSLIVDAGGRVDVIPDAHWVAPLPRVGVKYFMNPDFALTFAAGEYAQWIRSLAREDVPIRPLDLWVASDSAFPPSRAWHYVVGLEHWMTPSRYVRIEGFLKRYRNLVEANPFDDVTIPGDEFLPLAGRSFGGDLLIRQLETERFNGWLSYTYLLNTRTDATGFRFFPGQDRRHDLNVVANWRFQRYTFGTRFLFATGTPYTAVVGEYERRAYDAAAQRWSIPGQQDRQFLTDTRDGERLPTTHRLDVSITRHGHVKGVSVSTSLSIVNVYARGNVYAFGYDYSRSPPVRTALPQFPFLPTVGVSIVW
jgi:hypothetical protein